jgi:hypothetical protein
MTNYPYILFNQSPEQLRRIGARGGRAYGRNQRARRHATRADRGPHSAPGKGNSGASHRRAGRTIPLATRCRKATFPEPAFRALTLVRTENGKAVRGSQNGPNYRVC